MKLSIVTINYNNSDGLRKTLASVAAQTYREIEHVIVDAASTDASVDVIRAYERACKYPIIWRSEPDEGVYAGMNKGIRKATGEYVFILNSGDELAAPDVVERMVEILKNEDRKLKIDLLIGNILHVGAKEKRGREKKRDKSLVPRVIETSMLTFYSGTVPHDAAFIRRNLFEKYGYFDEKMKICADWKLYLNMIALGGVQPWHVDIDVVLFDMNGVSNTNNELRLAERRAYLKQLLPAAVLKDYDAYAKPIRQYERLKNYHLWSLVTFIERVLFKFEKWHILKK